MSKNIVNDLRRAVIYALPNKFASDLVLRFKICMLHTKMVYSLEGKD